MSAEQVVGSGGSVTAGSLLPPPPAAPPDLTRATTRYKRHAWLAVAGLLGFVALYLSLTGWFCWTAVRLFSDMTNGGADAVLDAIGGALSALLGAFLLGALFFIKSGGKQEDLEVTPEQEPALFAFLNALADRAGAQRPHRVFLSMRVNAAVFYDLSFVNLLFPTKKNLEIGLALVNTLNLSEMTAVLAHEFGHFAQRSMAVGRWVYTAQQVAGQIVASRTWLDRALGVISSIDLRVAWIGWLMRIVVWSIRSLLDTAFGLVILAQRALGREMEFQADLVSVSLTGSDALVHALHRLGAADGAWSNALSIAAREAGAGRAVPDLFALQARIIERMAGILDEPMHGASPPLPSTGRQQHRVFEEQLAEPPRMWSTHPGNRDREDNAKRTYVPAEIDARPAFCLFREPERVRREATARLLKQGSEKPLEPLTHEAALAAVDTRFERPHLARRYRGAYLGRSIVLHERVSDKLYGEVVPDEALNQTLQALYPEALASDLRDLRQKLEERAHLEALHEGMAEAPGGVIKHRGRVIPRRQLVSVLEQVKSETRAAELRVEAHDKLCRSSHRAAARRLGRGWESYLCAVARLHHYAAHAEANLEDARGHLANVFAIVTADGRVTSGERQRLVVAATEVHSALWAIFEQRGKVELPPHVLQRLTELLGIGEAEEKPVSWADVLPKNFSLPLPSQQNIGDFLGVIDSWINGALVAIGALERVSLELLVDAEARVREATLAGTDIESSPEEPAVPKQYATLVRGQERERQRRLGWWDRFQVADGLVPSVARFVVAGGILAIVLSLGGRIGHPTVTVLNGLGLPVLVEIEGQKLRVEPHRHAELTLERGSATELVSRSEKGEVIERFPVVPQGSKHYVYNVAGATSVVQWTATYGSASSRPPHMVGALRWFASDDDYRFEEPPKSISSKTGSGTKSVLSAFPDAAPYRAISAAKEDERAHVVEAHALWDEPGGVFLVDWLHRAASAANGAELIRARLSRYPNDMSARRLEQDTATGPAKAALCATTRSRSQADPNNLDALYLALRCPDDDRDTRQQFLDAHLAHPEHPYLANAAGRELQRRHDYTGAARAYTAAARELPLRDQASLELARLGRVTGTLSQQDLQYLAAASPSLSELLALERGGDDDDAAKSISFLARGELPRAVELARGNPETLALVLPLAAASDGASIDLVDQALDVLDRVKVPAALFAAIALADREQRPHAALDARLLELPGVNQGLLRFANPQFLKRDPVAAEAALEELPAEYQPLACVMALVRVSAAAPVPCRDLAKGALFASERPYFR